MMKLAKIARHLLAQHSASAQTRARRSRSKLYRAAMEGLESRRYFDWEQLDWGNSSIPDPINEGDTAQMHFHILQDSNDWFSAVLDYGDGNSDSFSNSVGSDGISFTDIDADVSHYFGDNASMTLTVTNPLWYEPWYYNNSYSWSVNNISPSAELHVDLGDGGGQYTVSLDNPLDPGEADVAAGLHFSFATSYEGLADTYSTSSSQGFDLDLPSGTVWARIFDKDGGYSDYNTEYVLPTLNWTNLNGWDNESNTTISFNWLDIANGEAGWRVQRSNDGTNFTTIADLAANSSDYSDSNIVPGTRYWYRVRAVGNGQDTAYSAKRAITARPPNPTGVSANSDLIGTTAAISWTAPSDPTNTLTVSGYQILQRTNQNTLTLVDSVGASSTTASIANLLPSSTYSYVVRALWSNGRATDSIETPLKTIAPNDLTITANFNYTGDPNKESLTLSFGSALSNLINVNDLVLTNIDTDFPVAMNLVNASATGVTLTFSVAASGDRPAGVLPDGNYRLQVLPGLQSTDGKRLSRPFTYDFFSFAGDANHDRHVDGADLNVWTANFGQSPRTFAQADFNYDGSVGAVDYYAMMSRWGIHLPVSSGFNVWGSSESQINLTWEDTAYGEVGWRVQRSTDGHTFSNYIDLPADSTYFKNEDLNPGDRFWYRVGPLWDGAPTAFRPSTAGATVLPGPIDLEMTNVTTTSAHLTWDLPGNLSNFTGFRILKSIGGGAFIQEATVSAATLSYDVTGLSSSTAYQFEVQAYRDAVESAPTPPVGLEVDPVPTALTTSARSDSIIDLAWINHASFATEYEIERSSDNSNWTQIAVLGPDATTYADADSTLREAKRYYYRVRAIVARGPTSYSNVANTYTLSAGPADLSGYAISASAIQLNWVDNSDGEQQYLVERYVDGTGFVSIDTLPSDSQADSIGGLTANTDYVFRIRVHNAGGDSFSDEVTVTSGATGPVPSDPLDLVVSSSFVLQWTDNSSNETGFHVWRRDGVTGTWAMIQPVDAGVTSWTDTSVAANHSYYYHVTAYNANGESGATDDISATTSILAPSALSAMATGNDGEIQLGWTDNSGNEFGFHVYTWDGTQWVLFDDVPAHDATGSTTYVASNLINGTSYTFAVQAYTDTISSSTSPGASATPLLRQITATGPSFGVYDSPYTLNLGTGGVTGSLTWSIDWGDDSDVEFKPNGTTSVTHTYTNPGDTSIRIYHITVTATSGAQTWHAAELAVSIGTPVAVPVGYNLDSSAGRRAVVLQAFQDVYNTIKYEAYPGLKKGPAGTAATKAGNDWDQAALLKSKIELAMAGSLNKPDLIYAYGLISVPAKNVLRWLGARDTQSAKNMLSEAGVYVSDSNNVFTLKHAWLRVKFSASTHWDLDPSWKYRDIKRRGTSNYDVAIDAIGGTQAAFDPDAYLTATTREDLSPLDWYETQISSYLKTQPALKGSTSIADVPFDGPIVVKNFLSTSVRERGYSDPPIIATEYSASGVQYADNPNSTLWGDMTHRVRITLKNSSGNTILTDISMPDLGATPVAVAYTDIGGGQLKAELFVGQPSPGTSRGSFNVSIGQRVSIWLQVADPGTAFASLPDNSNFQRTAGQALSFMLDAGQIAAQDLTTLQSELNSEVNLQSTDYVKYQRNLLQLVALTYARRFDDQRDQIGRLTGTVPSKASISFGLVTGVNQNNPAELKVPGTGRYTAQNPLFFYSSGNGITVDLPGLKGAMLPLSQDGGSADRMSHAFAAVGYMSSALESSVLEEVTNAEAASTVKGFRWAAARSSLLVFMPNSRIASGSSGIQTTNLFQNERNAHLNDTTTDYLWCRTIDAARRSIDWQVRGVQTSEDVNGNGVLDQSEDINGDGTLNSGEDANHNGILDLAEDKNGDGILSETFLSPENRHRVTVPREIVDLGKSTDAALRWQGVTWRGETAAGHGYLIMKIGGTTASGGASTGVPVNLLGDDNKATQIYPHQATNGLIYGATLGDPVNTFTGGLYNDETDISFSTPGLPLVFSRHYDSTNELNWGMGPGWTFTYGDRLSVSGSTVSWQTSQGEIRVFKQIGSTTAYSNPSGIFGTFTRSGSVYTYKEKDGTIYTFQDKRNGIIPLARIQDRNGNALSIGHSGKTGDSVVYINDAQPANKTLNLSFTYSGSNLTTVSDSTGRAWKYQYTGGELSRVTLPASSIYTDYVYYTGGSDPRNGLLKSITRTADGGAAPARYSYDYYPNRRVFSTKDPLNHIEYFSYNLFKSQLETSVGALATSAAYHINYNGDTTQTVFNENGMLARTINPDRSRIEQEWIRYDTAVESAPVSSENARFLIRSRTNEVGLSEWFGYEGESSKAAAHQNSAYIVVKSGNIVRDIANSANYNPWNSPSASGPSDGITTLYSGFDAKSNRPQTITVLPTGGSVSRKTANVYDPANGDLLNSTDPLGQVTSYTYDAAGRVITKTDPEGNAPDSSSVRKASYTTTYGYQSEPLGLMSTVQHPLVSNGPLVTLESRRYDNRGNLLRAMDGTNLRTDCAYDVLGRKLSETVPFKATSIDSAQPSGTAAPAFTTYTWRDQVVKSVTQPRNIQGNGKIKYWTTTNSYDGLGRLTKSIDDNLASKTINYDAMGNVASSTDVLGRTVQYFHDSRNRTTATLYEDGAFQRNSYDGLGRVVLASVPRDYVYGYRFDPVASTQTSYTSQGQVAETVDPANQKIVLSYNGFGELNDQKFYTQSNSSTPYKQINIKRFDALGRVLEQRSTDGTVTTTNYDRNGNVIQLIRYDMSNLNSILSKSLPSTVGSKRITSTRYDVLNRPILSQDPAGNITQTRYDAAGRVVATTDARGVGLNIPVADLSTFQPPSTSRFLRPTFWEATIGTPTLFTASHIYDDNGRLLKTTEPIQKTGEFAVQHTYLYNPDGSMRQESDNRAASTITKYAYSPVAVSGQTYITKTVIQGVKTLTSTTTNYDLAGQVSSFKNGNNQVTSYVYDPLGRQILSTLPKPDYFPGSATGPTERSYFDQAGNIRVQKASDTADSATGYDALHRATSTRSLDAVGSFVSLSLDTSVTTDSSESGVKRNNDGSLDIYFINPNPNWTAGVVQFSDSSIDANITESSYETVTIDSTTHDLVVHVDADQSSNVSLLLRPGLSARRATTLTSASSIFQNNNLISSKDGREYETTYSYDLAGHVIAQSVSQSPNPTTTTPRDQLYSSVYDTLGQLSSNTVYRKSGQQQGMTTTYAYDPMGRVVSQSDQPDGVIKRTTTRGYDAVGNLLWETDPLGNNKITATPPTLTRTDALNKSINTTKYTYDAMNRQLSQTLPDPNTTDSAASKPTKTTYDDNANSVTVTDPIGNATTYTYDGLDRLNSESTHAFLSNAQPNQLVTRSYAYDGESNLTQVVDRNGRVRKFVPDALSQIRTEQWFASTTSTSPLRTITFTYDAAGQLTQADDSTNPGSFDFKSSYDGLGNETQQIQTLSGTHNATLTQAFDLNGNRIQMGAVLDSGTDALSNVTNKYSYNSLGQITRQFQMPSDTGVMLVYTDITLTGQPLEARRYHGVTDWSETLDLLAYREIWTGRRTFTYDSAGRLSTILRYVNSGTPIPSLVSPPEYSYTYDADDRVNTLNIDGTGVRSYSLDDRSQLTGAPGKAYAYDQNFNRVEVAGSAGADNRLKEDATWTYSYDAEGNLLSKVRKSDSSNWAFVYDHRNRMTTATHRTGSGFKDAEEANTYDAADRRTARTSTTYVSGGSTTTAAESYVYDGTDILMVVQLSDMSLKARYFWDADSGQIIFGDTVPTYSTGNWYLTDQQGSVRKVLDTASGGTVTTIDYDAFGNITSGTNLPRFTYTSQEFDGPTGLYNYGARFYDATSGRFINQDPAGEGSNPYAYVMNDPMDRTDPSGMMSQFNASAWASEVSGHQLPNDSSWLNGAMDFGGALSSSYSSYGRLPLQYVASPSAANQRSFPTNWRAAALSGQLAGGPYGPDEYERFTRNAPLFEFHHQEVLPLVNWGLGVQTTGLTVAPAAMTGVGLIMAGETLPQIAAGVGLTAWSADQMQSAAILQPTYTSNAITNATGNRTAGEVGNWLVGFGLSAGGEMALSRVGNGQPLVQRASQGVANRLNLTNWEWNPNGVSQGNAVVMGMNRPPFRYVGSASLSVGSGNSYSVAFEVNLPKPKIPAGTRAAHFQGANAALLNEMDANPAFAAEMKRLIPDVAELRGPLGGVSYQPPRGWTWNHALQQPGTMQLVPRVQHTPGSAAWWLMHERPTGTGGFAQWGSKY